MATKKKYIDGLRNSAPAELQKELTGLLRERFNLRMQKGSGQLTRPDQMRVVRRNIAKLKTVLRERAL